MYTTASGLPQPSLKDEGKVPSLVCLRHVIILFFHFTVSADPLSARTLLGWLGYWVGFGSHRSLVFAYTRSKDLEG